MSSADTVAQFGIRTLRNPDHQEQSCGSSFNA